MGTTTIHRFGVLLGVPSADCAIKLREMKTPPHKTFASGELRLIAGHCKSLTHTRVSENSLASGHSQLYPALWLLLFVVIPKRSEGPLFDQQTMSREIYSSSCHQQKKRERVPHPVYPDNGTGVSQQGGRFCSSSTR
jgi:hypothetical protein